MPFAPPLCPLCFLCVLCGFFMPYLSCVLSGFFEPFVVNQKDLPSGTLKEMVGLKRVFTRMEQQDESIIFAGPFIAF